VLVDRDQASERARVETAVEEGGRGPVSGEGPVRHERIDPLPGEPGRLHLGARFVGRLAAHQRLGLREEVGEEHRVVVRRLALGERGVLRERGGEEVRRHQPRSLVKELEEGVLPVRTRLSEQDRPGVVTQNRPSVPAGALAVALHVELLQEGREALQALVVREHRVRLGPEEVAVPDPEQPEHDRDVPPQLFRAEVLVDLEGPLPKLVEPVHAEHDRGGEPDRRPAREPTADPIPEAEHVLRFDAEGPDRAGVGGNGYEVAPHGLLPEVRDEPGARGAGVRQRLLRGEGLRDDHEERRLRAQLAQRAGEVGSVDVGHEVCPEAVVPVRAQGLRDEARTQVGAADAEVHDVGDRLAGVAPPGAGADPLGEGAHLLQHRLDLRHDVLSVYFEGAAGGAAQGHVQHSPVLGSVDAFSAEHPVDPLRQAGFLRQAGEQVERLGRDPILREVDEQVVERQMEPVEPAGVRLEQVAEVGGGELVSVGDQPAPGGEFGELLHGTPLPGGLGRLSSAGPATPAARSREARAKASHLFRPPTAARPGRRSEYCGTDAARASRIPPGAAHALGASGAGAHRAGPAHRGTRRRRTRNDRGGTGPGLDRRNEACPS